MKNALWITILLCFIVGCSTAEKQPIDVYKDLSVYPIQAHRGAGLALPENTIESFLYTWGMGFIPEADIRTTSDDIIICMHDKTPKRLAPNAPVDLINENFENVDLKTVKSLDVGEFRGKPGQRIPTLEEVFQIMKGHPERFLYLDYKKIDLDRLADLVRKYKLEEQIIFTSKHHDLIMEWNKRIPQSLSLMWIGGDEKKIEKTFEKARENNFLGITTIQIHVKLVDEKTREFSPSPEFLKQKKQEVESNNILFQVLPWKIKEPDIYQKMLEMGVRSFATDYPEMTLKVYNEFLD